MSGITDYNYPQFIFAAEALRANGVKIISPAEIEPPDPEVYKGDQAIWDYFMGRCRQQVALAQALILLPGWPFSKGSRQEIAWMHGDTGCPTYFFAPNKLHLTDMNFPKETIFSDGVPAAAHPTAGASDSEGAGG
jgi:hypothetical protein